MPRFPEQLHLRPCLEPRLHFADRKQQRDYLIWATESIQLQLTQTLDQVIALDYELSPYLDNLESKPLPSMYIFLDSEEVAKQIETQANSLDLSVKRSHYSKLSKTGYISAPITLELTFRHNRHRTVTSL